MKRKIIIAILFLISISSICFASKPDYSIIENFEDSYNIGDNKIGDLIFNKDSYIPNIINIYSFNNTNMQKYDRIIWKNQTSIKIKNPNNEETILTTNSEYTIAEIGIYSYQSNSNSSLIGTITSQKQDDLIINISENDEIFDLSYNNSFLLESEEKTIPIYMNLTKNIEPGDYNIKFDIKSQYKNISFEKNVKVNQKLNWTIKENITNNISIYTDSVEKIGTITINNTGNKRTTIYTEITGDANNFLAIPKNRELLSQSYIEIDVYVQIGINQKIGKYSSNIEIYSDGNNSYDIPINIEIKDSHLPEIRDIEFSHQQVWKENKITINTYDNNKVVSASIKYNNVTANMTKDQNNFIYESRFYDQGNYNFTFCIKDDSNNEFCNSTIKKLYPLDIINYTNTININTKKVGKFSEIIILDTISEIPEKIGFKIKSFTDENDLPFNNYIIRLIDGDGSTTDIEQNKTYEIKGDGEVKLEIRSMNITSFNMILTFDDNNYTNKVNDIKIKGKFADYEVSSNLIIDWFNDQKIKCDVSDTGEVETSKYICPVEFPITTNIEDISLPTTIKEKKFMDEKIEENDNSHKSKLFIYNIIIGLLAGIVAFTLLLFYFSNNIYKYMRIKVGGNK